MLRSHKGFTLIELMVVVGILAILAAIVTASLVGTRSHGEETAVKTDAYAAQNAIQRFNSESVGGNAWPDAGVNKVTEGGAEETWVKYAGIPMFAADGITALHKDNVEYTTFDWSASTLVMDSSGNRVTRELVPNFLTRKPTNVGWKQTVSGQQKDVYAWVLLKGSVLDSLETRTVEVFKLNAAGDRYLRIYPE